MVQRPRPESARSLEPDERHQQRRVRAEEAEVVRAARAPRLGQREARLRQELAHAPRDRRIVREQRLARLDRDLDGAVVCATGRLDQRASGLAQRQAIAVVERAQRRPRIGVGRNHVRRVARVHGADVDDRGMQRVDATADQAVQADDHLGHGEDRIAPEVRVRAVARLPGDAEDERVGRGVDRAGVGADRAPRDAGVHVRRDDGSHALEHAGLDEHLGAEGVCLLARLEERPERRGAVVAEPDHRPRERDERRHVHVVAAGVHAAVLRREADAGLLDDREPVELGARDDRRAALADAYEQPGAHDALGGRREGARDERCGRRLAMAELGHRVQPAAQLDRGRQLVVDQREQPVEHPAVVSGRKRRDGTPPRPRDRRRARARGA